MTTDRTTECRLYRITGRVQGVWFRESTRQQAEPLAITGYAKNLPDGSVEVLACGEPDALDRLGNWLHRGPAMARVDRVDCEDAEAAPPVSFATR
jgi:acylphosphatase